METAKHKIETAVKEYTRLFPEEYRLFKKATVEKVSRLKDDFATTGQSNVIERHLYDVPEQLHSAIYQILTDQEYDWYTGRGEFQGSLSAAQWFIGRFPEFKITSEF